MAVTTVFPRPRGLLVSEFTDKRDFISALLTSCHIPWYDCRLDCQLSTKPDRFNSV